MVARTMTGSPPCWSLPELSVPAAAGMQGLAPAAAHAPPVSSCKPPTLCKPSPLRAKHKVRAHRQRCGSRARAAAEELCPIPCRQHGRAQPPELLHRSRQHLRTTCTSLISIPEPVRIAPGDKKRVTGLGAAGDIMREHQRGERGRPGCSRGAGRGAVPACGGAHRCCR